MSELSAQQTHSRQHGRRDRSENDMYHVRACRCDLTNTCISSKESSPVTLVSELFLCLETESKRIAFDRLLSLKLDSDHHHAQSVWQGSSTNPRTWVTVNDDRCIIRTRLDREFFQTNFPSNTNLNAVAEGIVTLKKRKRNKQNQIHEQQHVNTTVMAKHAHHHHNKNNTTRWLNARTRDQNLNVSVPFRVEISVKPAESVALETFMAYSPLILVILTIMLCCAVAACKAAGERRQDLMLKRALSSRRSLSSSGSSTKEEGQAKVALV